MRRSAILVVASALAACGGGKASEKPGNLGAASYASGARLPSVAIAPPRDTSPKGLDAHVLVSVPEGGIGPFLARRDGVVMAAYVGVGEDGKRRVVSVPLAANGDVRSDAKVIAPLAGDVTTLLVRPTGGSKPGFVTAWTSLTDRGEALTVVGVRDDGRALGGPTELARTTDDIVWVGIVPTRAGALVVWAEQTRGGDANVLAAALGSDGAMRGVPSRVARGVTSWQLVATPAGGGLALVAPLASGPGGAKSNALTWTQLDTDGHPAGAPVVVSKGARVSGDVDATHDAGGALLAWTDLSEPDPQTMVARVDDAGHVAGPRRATQEGAGGALVGVAPGLVAWEEPFRRGSAGRRVMVARVGGPTGTEVHAPVPLELEGRGDPEIVRTGAVGGGAAGESKDGYALLAPARACASSAASCVDAPVVPTFVRFDPDLGILQVEPLRLGVLRESATVGWSLSCADGGECLALAVGGDAASPHVLAVDLPVRPSAFRAPLVPPAPPGAPAIESIGTAVAGAPLAELAAVRVGEATILVILGAEGQEAKRTDGVPLTVRALAGTAAPGEATMTKRALAVGGVAIAATGRPEDGAAIAWVARDGGDPQVHVTRVDAKGKLVHDAQITTARGDASDVAIAWAGDHWIVAWVDGRDGNGEVYATTLDRAGRSFGRGQRITNAPGDASDVALVATEDGVWAAWADPRESPQDGFADVYAAPLRPKDAARVGDEVRVLATAAHSRSPVLAARGHDVALGWIEEAPMGAQAARARAYGAMLAWLDPAGKPLVTPTHVRVAGDGFPTAIALDGSSGTLHGVLARSGGDAIVLDALDVQRDGSGTPYPLVTLDGPPSLDVSLAIVGDQLLFNDEGPDAGARRARRAIVRWPR